LNGHFSNGFRVGSRQQATPALQGFTKEGLNNSAFARHSREGGNPVSFAFKGLKSLDDQPAAVVRRFPPSRDDGSYSDLPGDQNRRSVRNRRKGFGWL
jgi:hypothetical protein